MNFSWAAIPMWVFSQQVEEWPAFYKFLSVKNKIYNYLDSKTSYIDKQTAWILASREEQGQGG